jgi:basic membrane protein A
MHRRPISILAILSLVVLLTSLVPAVVAQDGPRIGLVTDVGEVDDRSFNQSAWEGVQAAAEMFDGEARYIETQDSTDYADNIAEFAENDFDIIVTVGFALGEATAQAAVDYPDVHFIGVDQFQGEAVPNVTGLVFHEDQAGYLAGVLAANLTESGTLAGVYGTDLVPPVVMFARGFEAGALAANADLNVITTYHPGGLDVAFTDPEWGATTAAQAIDQGADVIFAAGGKTGNGGLTEVANRTTEDNPLFCIGVDTDQWETVPEAHPCLISSATKVIPVGITDIVSLVVKGEAPAGNYFGPVGLASFHDFEDTVPEELKAELESIAAALTSGELETGVTLGGEEEAVEMMPLRIGLVTDVGEVDDRSFNQSAWEGVQAAAEMTGGEAQYIETQDSTDYADNIAEFAENGFDVIVTVGFALGEATIEAAADYPDIYFIGVDQFQGEALPNVAGLVFHEDQAGYLAGVLAANLTESGTLAGVYGTDLVPPVVMFARGFEAGALATNADLNVITTYHPGGLDVAFTDPEWGGTTAAQAIDQGADVIFSAGGKTGNGGLTEVANRTTEDNPLYCIGVDTDQWGTLPEAHACLISSAMKVIPTGIEEIVELIATGNAPSGNFFGPVGLAPFHDFEDTVPEELKAELESIAAALTSGELETGVTLGE